MLSEDSSRRHGQGGTSELRPEGQEGSSHRKSREGGACPAEGRAGSKTMWQEKGLLCQMDKKEAGVLGEDERAGCHIREDLESPEGVWTCSQGPLQFSKSMHGMVHIFSNHLATELQIGLEEAGEPGGLGSGWACGGGSGKGRMQQQKLSKSSWWLGTGWWQRSERKVRPEAANGAGIDRICC